MFQPIDDLKTLLTLFKVGGITPTDLNTFYELFSEQEWVLNRLGTV
jgi:hypothetical protein